MNKIYLTEIVLLTKTYNIDDFNDWLKWHLDIIHFDHIVVFDNESSVDIKSICQQDERIEYHFVKGFPNQYNIYNKYINNESKAWWVLPIDDDEFLYVGEKFNHDVNKMILDLQDNWKDMCKFSACWVNMFSPTFIEDRNDSLLNVCTSYSYEACEKIREYWRQDNRWVKTFVKTTRKWTWAFDENGKYVNDGHNPTLKNKLKSYSYLINGAKCYESVTDIKKLNEDCFLAHFQYKSNNEWISKCKNRKSPATKGIFDKNKPRVYEMIYTNKIYFSDFNKIKEIWNLYDFEKSDEDKNVNDEILLKNKEMYMQTYATECGIRLKINNKINKNQQNQYKLIPFAGGFIKKKI